MKKIAIALLGLASVVCLGTSAGLVAKTASAETAEQTYTVELSKTVYKVSNDDSKMLLVTAIKDFSLVYEVGYDFTGYTVGASDVAETNKYYDTLTTGGVTEDADDIFGAEWTGAKLLVWEVANTEDVTFTAYAKEGVMENGYLVKPDTEIKKVGTTRSNTKYTVTFVNEDGTVLATQEVYNGKTPTYEETPTQDATAQYTYEFKGWDNEFAPVTEDVTYTATYTATTRQYTVSFNANGGETVEAVKVDYGTPASALANVTTAKTGYTFVGWTFEDGSAIPDDATVTSDITVKAAWEVTTYTAKIARANGTEETVEFTIENRAEKLAAIALTANDAQYTYSWLMPLPAELALSNTQVFTETRTVNNYTVTFNANGGSAVAPVKVAYGTPASGLANYTSNLLGYTFLGWTLEDGTEIPNGATVTSDITVKAAWEVTTYTAKIARANGTEETVEFTIENRAEKLAAIALTANDAQYTYAWANTLPTELALNNEQVFTETRTVNNYTVTFDVDGGSAIEAQVVPYGTPASALASFTTSKAGYIFAGWKVLYGGNYIDIPEGATVTGDMTVKAVWNEMPVVEVATASELAEQVAKGNVKVKLVDNIAITTSGTFIDTLNVVLDLNGYTLSRNSSNAADRPIIETIGAFGVLKNGKIYFEFGPSEATAHTAYMINKNNGLVENVEVEATVDSSWDWNNLVGLFENNGDGTGTYRNVVVNVTNVATQGPTAFGVFRQVGAGLTLENCIIIKNGAPFTAYNAGWGMSEMTFANLKGATGSVMFNTVAEYTASSYNTSSFSSEYWTIDQATKLPKYKVVVNAVEVSTAAELQAEVLKGSSLIKLTNDIVITASGMFIDTLNVVIDLNGHTIWRSSSNATDRPIIETIGASGVLKNGKINFEFGPSEATAHTAYMINKNNGLVENVEVEATVDSSWDWNNLVGLFENNGDGTGTYRNVVVNVTNIATQGPTAFGVFRQVGAGLTLENCIIIKNGAPFTAYNAGWGMSEMTFANLKNATGSVMFNTVAEYTAANYDASSFSSEYWTIDEATKLPKMIIANEIKVSNETELLFAIAKGIPTIKLMNDIVITKSGMFIETLNVVLDLNGYTLSRSSNNPADRPIIETIGESGVLKNGKIVFEFGPSEATAHTAYIINKNNGLVENVEVVATVDSSWDWNNLVGLFENNGDGTGIYRNVVVNVTNVATQGPTAFGVFRQVGAGLTLENCIIIKNGAPFTAYNAGWGMSEMTFANLKDATGSAMFNTVEEYIAAGYDTSSFSSEYWTIDEVTKLPTIKR